MSEFYCPCCDKEVEEEQFCSKSGMCYVCIEDLREEYLIREEEERREEYKRASR